MKGELPKHPTPWNDSFSFSLLLASVAVGFGRAGLCPPLGLIHITTFLAPLDVGRTVPVSTYTGQTTEHGTGLRSSKGMQFFVLFVYPCNFFLQGECKLEQPDHNCDSDFHKGF